jgi:hypothetical protein
MHPLTVNRSVAVNCGTPPSPSTEKLIAPYRETDGQFAIGLNGLLGKNVASRRRVHSDTGLRGAVGPSCWSVAQGSMVSCTFTIHWRLRSKVAWDRSNVASSFSECVVGCPAARRVAISSRCRSRTRRLFARRCSAMARWSTDIPAPLACRNGIIWPSCSSRACRSFHRVKKQTAVVMWPTETLSSVRQASRS